MKKQKLDKAIVQYVKNGGRLSGICGGYQMLGEEIVVKEERIQVNEV
ncbi:hypothetical protein KHA80_01760 [Anaerobacillus sp. HL2]|nr:hypothetical protein KHA80_01760 [Anaerobacillus sp. HL2]